MSQNNENSPGPAAFVQNDAVNILRACISGASFWTPEQLSAETKAWLEHAPFAFWLTEILRPRVFVELGTHRGFSYFAFCEAVQRLRLPTRCYAVDTWRGDEHAGFYGEEIFQTISAAHDHRYSAFSTLIRSTFEAASHHFSDGCIDLLHIDGRHHYDDVKNDYENWRAKLSDRSVVLFHDTNVRERDFGVYRFWEELRRDHPHFEFLHGNGLGVLGTGKQVPDDAMALFLAGRDQEATALVRSTYARLGAALPLELTVKCQAAELSARGTEWESLKSEADRIRNVADAQSSEITSLRSQLQSMRHENEALESDLRTKSEQEARLDSRLRAEQEQNEVLTSELCARGAALAGIRGSNSWRVTKPLRWFATKLRWMGLQSHLCRRVRSYWQIRQDTKLIEASVLFDGGWYLERNPDVRASKGGPATHYLRHGAIERRVPSTHFDSDRYLEQNEDVRKAGVNPLVHYLRHGRFEGRSPVPPLEQLSFASPAADRAPIRVLAVTHNLNHEGAPNNQFEVVTGLHGLNVIESAVLSTADGPLASVYREAGVQVQVIPTPTLTTGGAFEKSAGAITRIFRESGAEIVYANTLQTFWAIAIAERAHVPSIWNVHESEPPQSYFSFLTPEMRALAYRCLQYPHRVVFGADATRQIWEPLKSRDNFTTIHNALDPDRLRERSARWHRRAARTKLGVSDGEVTILIMGTVCERKGQLDLLRSLPLLPAELMPRLRIFFVGDRNGPYSAQLHAEANALPANISSRVVIVAETHEPYLYFRASDVAVCCSRIECYPRVILEAMAFDLPLVTTPVFGIAEQVQNKVNGLFYPPGDIAQLASHLARLISDESLRAEMASASSRVLASLPNHSATLDRYACLFREGRLDWALPS